MGSIKFQENQIHIMCLGFRKKERKRAKTVHFADEERDSIVCKNDAYDVLTLSNQFLIIQFRDEVRTIKNFFSQHMKVQNHSEVVGIKRKFVSFPTIMEDAVKLCGQNASLKRFEDQLICMSFTMKMYADLDLESFEIRAVCQTCDRELKDMLYELKALYF